jgi:AI-2 transport system permease protein
MNKVKKLFVRWETFLVLIIVLEFVVFGSLNPKFLNIKRLFSGLNQFIPVCIISLFVTFVMITGGIDIQAGSIVWLTSITVGVLWHDAGLNIFVACILALVAGALCGGAERILRGVHGRAADGGHAGRLVLYSGMALAVSNLSSTPLSGHQRFSGGVQGAEQNAAVRRGAHAVRHLFCTGAAQLRSAAPHQLRPQGVPLRR